MCCRAPALPRSIKYCLGADIGKKKIECSCPPGLTLGYSRSCPSFAPALLLLPPGFSCCLAPALRLPCSYSAPDLLLFLPCSCYCPFPHLFLPWSCSCRTPAPTLLQPSSYSRPPLAPALLLLLPCSCLAPALLLPCSCPAAMIPPGIIG